MSICKNINRIKCTFGYHKYYLIKKLTPWSRKIGCKNCNDCFAMNDDVKSVIKWDKDIEDMYKTIGVL